MNIIEKVIIKDGVNADIVIALGYFTGQVEEINDSLYSIPSSRGIASYEIIAGKPTFTFEQKNNNELWIYVDGIGFKANGITNTKQPSPYYFAPTSDGNQIVTIPNDSETARHIIIKQFRGGTDSVVELKINMSLFPENEIFKVTNASNPSDGVEESTAISIDILQIPDETNYKFLGYGGGSDGMALWEFSSLTTENVGSVELMRVGDNIYIL